MATFFPAKRFPNGDLVLSACADYEAHQAAAGQGCPFDYTATWGKSDNDESDAAHLARATAEHALLTDALNPAPAAEVDLARLGVSVAGGAV